MKHRVLLQIALLTLSASAAEAQWTATSGPASPTVYALAANGTVVFAGTDGGGVYRTTDNGTGWTQVLSGQTVWSLAVGGTNIFAGTNNSGVYFSTDSGSSWNSGLASNTVLSLLASGTMLFAGTYNGVYRSADTAKTWTHVSSGLTNSIVYAFAMHGSHLFAGTGGGGVFLSADSGASWNAVDSGLTNLNVFALVLSGTTVFAGTTNGIFRSSNDGTSWTAASTGLTANIVNAFALDGSNLLAGLSGGVFRSTDNGANWTSESGGLGNTFIRALAVSGPNLIAGLYGGGVYVSSLSALPVELVSFTAHVRDLTVDLTWRTATETNSYGFEIERESVGDRSASDNQWANIGFVASSGTSSNVKSYSFTDRGLSAGRYAYRLKQVDRSASVKYSNISTVEIGEVPKEFSLAQNYPNPFNPTTTIEFTVPSDGQVTLKVYDMLGREVATLVDGEVNAGIIQHATFDATRFASGTYISRLEFGGNRITKRMALIK